MQIRLGKNVEVRKSLVDRNQRLYIQALKKARRGSQEPRGSKQNQDTPRIVLPWSRFARASWIETFSSSSRTTKKLSRFARASWIETHQEIMLELWDGCRGSQEPRGSKRLLTLQAPGREGRGSQEPRGSKREGIPETAKVREVEVRKSLVDRNTQSQSTI